MKFLPLVLSALFSLSAHAACIKEGETVTLDGVLMNKAIKMDPRDFGWVPKDGFVGYTVLVVANPVCLIRDGEKVEGQYVVQLGAEGFSAEELHQGVAVRVKGMIGGEDTAHHFQKVLLFQPSITRK